MMPFGIRRFTLQRSFSTESGGGGSKLPKSKSHDAAGGHGNVHGSATHGGSTVGGTGTLLSASRSVDQADLRRLGDPPGYSSQSGGGAGVRQGQGGGGVNHQNSAVNSGASQSLAAIQPPRLPPRGPPRRSASVDQANPPSQGEYRQSFALKSYQIRGFVCTIRFSDTKCTCRIGYASDDTLKKTQQYWEV